MPLGAFRLNSLAKKSVSEVSYRPVTVTSVGESGEDSGFYTRTANSKFGFSSAYSNGSNRYLTLSDIPLGSGDWTIEFWFNPDSTAGNRTIIDFRESNNNATQLKPWIYVNGTKVNYHVNGAVRAQSTYYNVSAGQWYYCAVVKYNGVVSIYLRGYYDTPATSQYTDSNDYGVGPSIIGVNASRVGQNGTIQDDDFAGYIDEVRISKVARITSVPGSPGDYSPTAQFVNDDDTLLLLHMNGLNDGYVFNDDDGTGVSLEAVEFGSAVYYQNTAMPDAAAANKQVTMSVWMNIANTSPRSVAFGFRHAGSRLLAGPWCYNNGTAQTNATNRWYVQTSSQTLDRTSTENDLYEINEWHHFVYSVDFTVDNRNIAYVDGVQVTLSGFTASNITSNINWNNLTDFYVHGYTNAQNLNTIRVAQIWISDTYIDLSTNISKFYDNGPVDMGSDGTGSGLSQPLIYHNGGTSSFTTNGGSLSYSLSAAGGTPITVPGPSTY